MMRRFSTFFLPLLFLFSIAAAQEAERKGITESIFSSPPLISVGQAEEYQPVPTTPAMEFLKPLQDTIQWFVRDSIYFDSYIPAGSHLGVKFNEWKRRIEFITPYGALTTEAKSAIQKSPAWIRAALENTLSQLSSARQRELAAVINNANDPVIDEIAFAIAHSSVRFLGSNYCYPGLFAFNAEKMYENDKALNYVEIVDYGSSTTDENYYSTVRYWKMDSTFNTVQIEVPREIYYWYIVHPKTSDEISAYVDPALVESNTNHTTNIAPPPGGVFWRDFLFNHTEPNPDSLVIDLPILKDEASKCDILWADKDTLSQAVRVITKWINAVMNFTSGSERPHQPVRIYRLHIGRCGEHEDISAATARTCLIPCRGVSSYSTDHVWNEFWDEEWCQWEAVNTYLKRPQVYEKGWGKVFGSVFARRSDGVFIPVTGTYSEGTCKITVYALDPNNKPIDGAVIMLAMQDAQNILMDSFGTTDNEGKYTFTVGEGRTYFARMNSALGNFPTQQNQVTQLLQNAPDKGDYAYQLKASQPKTLLSCNPVTPPNDNTEDYRLAANFTVENQIINWQNQFDDINAVGQSYSSWAEKNGRTYFYIMDADNYSKHNSNTAFAANNVLENVKNGSANFNIPINQEWYSIFSNKNCINNPVHVKGSFVLTVASNINSTQSPSAIPASAALYQNYPNPFGASGIAGVSATTIRYSLSDADYVTLKVYDALGREVETLVDQYQNSGEYAVKFNAGTLTSGIYFYNLTAGKTTLVKMMTVVR